MRAEETCQRKMECVERIAKFMRNGREEFVARPQFCLELGLKPPALRCFIRRGADFVAHWIRRFMYRKHVDVMTWTNSAFTEFIRYDFAFRSAPMSDRTRNDSRLKNPIV